MYANVRELREDILERVRAGQHLLLYGPRGTGKSRLVSQLHEFFLRSNVPCAIAQSTSCLDDITRALEAAYPHVNIDLVNRRTARYRLWSAADRRRCVLLLDHLTDVSTAMIGYLRRLRGGIAGVLFVVDVDVEREQVRMRKRARSLALTLRMPLMSTSRLRRMLESQCLEHGWSVEPEAEHRLLNTARGRPGWITLCTNLMANARYWHEGHLYPTLLCTDTELLLRLGAQQLAGALSTGPASEKDWLGPPAEKSEPAPPGKAHL